MLFGKQRNLRRLAVKDNLQRRIVHRAETSAMADLPLATRA